MGAYANQLKKAQDRAADLGLLVTADSLFGDEIDLIVRLQYSEKVDDILLDKSYFVEPIYKRAARDIDTVCDHIQQMIDTNAGAYE